MSKAQKVITVLLLGCSLSACGMTLEERIQLKETCEEAGGIYQEGTNLVSELSGRCLLDERLRNE